jgi:hypothetical protein
MYIAPSINVPMTRYVIREDEEAAAPDVGRLRDIPGPAEDPPKGAAEDKAD